MNSIPESLIQDIVFELSIKSCQPEITIKIIEDPYIGAEIDPQTRILWFSNWLLEELTVPQLKGIIGHELGHLSLKALTRPKSGKPLILFGLGVTFSIWTILSYYFIDFFLWITTGIPLIAINLTLLGYINYRDELNADMFAITLTQDPEALLSALNCTYGKMKSLLKDKPRNLRNQTIEIIRFPFYWIVSRILPDLLSLRRKQMLNLINSHVSKIN
ncbi:MAG: M48 family metalloprotease [Candidatus Hermodarchaeota archaeon]